MTGVNREEANRASITASRAELIAIIAMMAATVAFATDAMLPAFPDISADLSPRDPNRAQLVVASFMVGLGVGTLFAGPLCDAFGRQTITVAGTVIIILFATVSALTQSLEVLLVARFLQGVGSAGPRVASMAIVRDLFRGREMARILSFVILVFTLAPVFAPSVGWLLTQGFGWRSIFASFAVFSIISTGWLLLRLPETLAREERRSLRVRELVDGLLEVFSNRQVMLAIGCQSLIFAVLMSTLLSSQQVFDKVFDRGAAFPLWFALMAALAAGASVMNAAIVMRVGMRRVVRVALFVHSSFTGVFLLAMITGVLPASWLFPVGFLWCTSVFQLAGFTLGNINAIAMEPMGHMAGLAASIITSVATIASIAIAAPIGQAFDGTLVPLTAATFVLTALALLLAHRLEG